MTTAPQFVRMWRSFAVTLTVLLVVGLLTQLREPSASTLIALPVTILSLNGLFGLGWQRPLLRKWVWQVLVVLQGVLFAPVAVGSIFFLVQATASVTQRFIVAAIVALEGLMLVGLYLYAFRSPHLWRRPPSSSVAEESTPVAP